VLRMGANLVGKRTWYLMCYDRAPEYRSVDDKCRLRSEVPEWTVTWCFRIPISLRGDERRRKYMGNLLGISFPCSSIHRTSFRDPTMQILQPSVLSESRTGHGIQECFNFNMPFIGLRTMESAECLAPRLEDLINIMELFTVFLAL
jgi:hypothetical protein